LIFVQRRFRVTAQDRGFTAVLISVSARHPGFWFDFWPRQNHASLDFSSDPHRLPLAFLCHRSRELRAPPMLFGPLLARGPFRSRIHRRISVRALFLFLLLAWVLSRGRPVPFSCRTRSAEGSSHARRWVPALLNFNCCLRKISLSTVVVLCHRSGGGLGASSSPRVPSSPVSHVSGSPTPDLSCA
jgi:hypothetical protein